MGLNDWREAGWLESVPQNTRALRLLLRGAERDLEQSRLTGLDPAWRYIIVYTATLNAATAALLVQGLRAGRDQHHYRTLQSLQFTIGLDSSTLRHLDRARKKRHLNTYDRAEATTVQEVEELTAHAAPILESVQAFVASHSKEEPTG